MSRTPRRPRRPAACVAAVLLGAAALCGPAASAAEPGPTAWAAADPCTRDGAHGFQASFITPYWFFGKTPQQVTDLFAAQGAAGSTGVILQWTSHVTSGVAAYPGSRRYGHFNDAVPLTLRAATDQGMDVWVGLAAAPGVLDTAERIDDPEVLADLAEHQLRTAEELWAAYGDQIDGWYLPIEPNEYSVQDDTVRQLQVRWLAGIVAELHARYPGVPVMVSPSMPRAIFADLSPVEFVERFEPFLTETGVDVWNIQDGFKMTAWTVEQEVAAFRLAQQTVGEDAEVWASVYTPGPGEPNYPTDPGHLQRYLSGLGAAGVPLTDFTFAEHMNPDTSLEHGADRSTRYAAYRDYCTG